jgi:hypothetical protein
LKGIAWCLPSAPAQRFGASIGDPEESMI